jgi:hypothetical protein
MTTCKKDLIFLQNIFATYGTNYMTVNETTEVKHDKELTVAIAKRFFGSKANGRKVDCMERAYDSKWEMIQLMPDPSLDANTLADLQARKLSHPYRWVTVDVVEPFVIEGINKSLKRVAEEKKNAE